MSLTPEASLAREPDSDRLLQSARRRHAQAQRRLLDALATAPLRELERLDAEADEAARALRAFGVVA